jgi:hypothetical protein
LHFVFNREKFKDTLYSILAKNIAAKIFTADLCQLDDVFLSRFVQLAEDHSLTPTCTTQSHGRNGYNMGKISQSSLVRHVM